ncbi:MAG: MgtC/SapB family protein [Usitatibacter sp.]
MQDNLEAFAALATSAGIGLLVGLERERNPLTKAGVRTFTLIAVLGTLATMIAQALGSGWIVAAGMLVVGFTLTGAFFADERTKADDSGTTTVVAAAVVFGLGAVVALGHRQVAVGVGVAMTALLFFKVELEGFSERLTPADLRTMLRFAVLSAVILPLLPDAPIVEAGPLAAINPYQLWLMVVLISGVSLAGYIAWRLTPGRHGLLVTGLLGGLASSTATTLMAAGHVRDGSQSPAQALVVILLANATMLVRVMIVVLVVAPGLAGAVASILGPALLLCLPAFAWHWRRAAGAPDEGEGTYRNPAGLRTALAFAFAYGVVLVLAAWVGGAFGAAGLYALAALSGSTDVDAITLSVARLHEAGELPIAVARTAVAIAVAANLAMKTAFVLVAGGRALGARTALGFVLPCAALALGAVLA